jgi:MFS family permease
MDDGLPVEDKRIMEGKRSFDFKWIVVGVSFTTLALTSTVLHSFSVFFVALLREFGWSRSTTAGALSLFLFLYGVIGPYAGSTVDRFGPRRVFVLGSLFLGTGVALCSLMSSWWHFYLFFGVIAAIGAGSTGWVTNSTVIQNWFREKRGLAIGLLSSGIGIGMSVCIPLIQHLINGIGWRMAYRVMAFFIPLTIIVMTVVFLRRSLPTTGSALAQQETSPSVTEDPLVVDHEWASRSWTLRQAMLTKQFRTLSVAFFFSTLINQSVLAHHVAFFVDEGLAPLFASYIVGVLGVVSIGAKIFWGVLSDRIGREITYTIVIACFICGVLSLITFRISSFSSLPYFYAVFFGMGYAGTAVLPPLITADFFGGRAYGSIFGTIFILNSVGAAFGAWFGGFLHDQVGNYLPFFIIVIACALLACFSVWIAAPRKIRRVPGKKVSGRRPRLAS